MERHCSSTGERGRSRGSTRGEARCAGERRSARASGRRDSRAGDRRAGGREESCWHRSASRRSPSGEERGASRWSSWPRLGRPVSSAQSWGMAAGDGGGDGAWAGDGEATARVRGGADGSMRRGGETGTLTGWIGNPRGGQMVGLAGPAAAMGRGPSPPRPTIGHAGRLRGRPRTRAGRSNPFVPTERGGRIPLSAATGAAGGVRLGGRCRSEPRVEQGEWGNGTPNAKTNGRNGDRRDMTEATAGHAKAGAVSGLEGGATPAR